MKAYVLLALGVCVFANASLLYANTPKSEPRRADVPWVSLAHQRALEASKNKQNTSVKVQVKKSQSRKKLAGKIAPELTADKFDYATDDSKTLIASGNARLSSSEFEVQAEKIAYSQKINAARVLDDVRISIDKNRIVAESADISVDGKTVKSGKVRFGSFPLFVSADSASGNENQYVLENAQTFFGEPGTGSISASSAKTTYDKPTNTVKMEDVYLRISDVPVFHFDEIELEAETAFPFEIRNRIDFNGDYGMAIQNTIHYTAFKDFAPGVLFDAYFKRSVLLGPAFRYDTTSANNRMKGFIQTGFIYDTGSRSILGENSYGSPIDRDRYFVELRHNQIYKERYGLTAVLSVWSDEFVTRDFRDEFFYNNQVPDNFVEGIYYDDMWTASLFTRFAPNNFELVQQRLPEGRIDVQPVELFKTGAYLRAFASAAYLHQYNPYPFAYIEAPVESIESTKIDSYIGVDRPIELSPWAKITPVAGVRLTSYFDAKNGSSNYTRALAQVGFDAQMDIWGQFDYSSRVMKIDGLRHHMMPFVSYRYIPEAEQGRNRFDVIDYDYCTTYPPILDLASMRNIDDMSELNTMRFGIRNVFETRDAVYGSRELARFDIFQDVNFNRRRPSLNYKYWNDDDEFEQEFSELYVHANISPARWLTVGTVSRFSLEHSCVPEVNNYITLMDSDMFSFTLGSVYLRQKLEQYYATAEYRLSERYQVFGSWHYDADLSEFVYQRYGLRTKLGNTWLIEYYLAYRNGSTREDSASVGVRVLILGL